MSVSAGADDVQGAARQVHGQGVIPHGVREAVDLLDSGSLHGHRREEGSQPGFTEFATHHLVHEPIGLAVVEGLPAQRGRDDGTPLALAHQ